MTNKTELWKMKALIHSATTFDYLYSLDEDLKALIECINQRKKELDLMNKGKDCDKNE